MSSDVPLVPVPPSPVPALLMRRRSCRAFTSRPLSSIDLASLVWAAQGRTTGQRRVTPSAHGLYPLALTVVVGHVNGIATGAYRYEPDRHVLAPVAVGDRRVAVADATLVDREWLRDAAALLLLSADLASVDRHFADQPPSGYRGRRYAWLEAGHAAQNVYLQATEVGLGAVVVAGFDDDRLCSLDPPLLPPAHNPLAILGLGHPAPQ